MNSTLSKRISNQAIYFCVFLLEEPVNASFSIETSSEFSGISIAKRTLSNYFERRRNFNNLNFRAYK